MGLTGEATSVPSLWTVAFRGLSTHSTQCRRVEQGWQRACGCVTNASSLFGLQSMSQVELWTSGIVWGVRTSGIGWGLGGEELRHMSTVCNLAAFLLGQHILRV